MKIKKHQLRKIIREEINKVESLTRSESGHHGIFSEDYIYDMLADDVVDFLQNERGTVSYMSSAESNKFRRAVLGAVEKLLEDYGEIR